MSLGLLARLLSGWPERASTMAPRVDHAMEGLMAASVACVVILAALNLFFIIRYREGSSAPRKPLGIAEWKIETTWIGATTVGFLGFFFWGARLYVDIERPPRGAHDIAVVARQWMWDIRQPNGRREFNELHVPTGTPIRLLMTSEDVIHSFYVPAFRIKQDVVPGKEVALGFTATRAGTYALFCSEFCGSKHDEMTGVVVAMDPKRYAEWLAKGAPPQGPVAEGRRLFIKYGCSGCHSAGSAVPAPALEGLYGKRVPMAGGALALADESYLRDSILQPAKTVPAGYQPVMPSFQGVIPEGELHDLIAYLKSLGADDGTGPQRRASP